MNLLENTKRTRHALVKLVAPRLFEQAVSWPAYWASCPRTMISFIKQNFDDTPLVGVEIGVAQGVNAESIIKTLHIKHLFLVDPYCSYVDDGRLYDYSLFENAAKKRLEKFSNITTFLRLGSDDAAKFIPNGLDFVYIDGDHSYAQVKRDVDNYFPKVKVGGVLGGNDLDLNVHNGLVNAVIEFCVKNRLHLFGKLADWWIVKTQRQQVDSE